jgi:type IV secretory pathway TrbF-like protein
LGGNGGANPANDDDGTPGQAYANESIEPVTNKHATSLNPYLHSAGRRAYQESHGEYVIAAQRWRLIGMTALIVAGVAVTVMIASQSQVVPYVVKVDRLGAAVAVDRADLAAKPDKAVIVAQLARWVMAVRSVWVDAGAQRGLAKEAYAVINARANAYGTLSDHMHAHNPFERAKTETMAVEVLSVLPISGDSWRIEWREETRSRDGVRAGAREFQATITISFNPPRDEATIRANPSGLYINSFSWAERLGGK